MHDPQQDQENRKTILYVGVALVALVIAWEPWRRATVAGNVPDKVGTKLFEEFKNPLEATSLEIIRFDESNASIHQFLVSKHNGVWSIPSHSNYPADAREHMAQAATALLDLEILSVPTDKPGEQELYGVITPDRAKLKQGMTGVGTRVTMRDDKDKVLADIVIGKEDKDRPGLRYVRREGRDQIYKVSIKTDKLSTKFEDWIEKDLLKLNSFDVKTVELNDYSSQQGMRPDGRQTLGINPRSRARLVFDSQKNNWLLIDLAEFDQDGKPVRVALGEDEELDSEKLNDMKGALDDLQIIDVERKPPGLSQDLRASEDFTRNGEALESLFVRGFYPAQVQGGAIELYSSEGEATCATKDGVKYVLRFGGLAGGLDDKTEDGAPDKKSDAALSRYLFVTVQFDPTQIQRPSLEIVPGEGDGEKAPDAEKPDAEKPAEATPETKTALEEPQAPAEQKAAETKAAEDKSAEPPAEAKSEQEAKPTTPPSPEEEMKIMIRRENKRRQDEYDEALKKGEAKVKELNDRFADWYFIISDATYKKIHLSRADIVKKKSKQPDEPEAPVNELKELQKGIDD